MSALIQAQQSISAGDLGSAREVLEAHVRRHPQDPDGLYLLGVCEQASGNGDAAQALYGRILGANADHFGAHYNLALLLSGQGRHEEAMPHHDSAIRLAPNNYWSYVNRGNARVAIKQYEPAIADYEQALRLQPDLVVAIANKGNALLEKGQAMHALECHERALRLTPHSVQAWLDMARTLIELGRFEEAAGCAAQALHLAPGHADAWCLQGFILNELRRYQEGWDSCQHALEIKSDHALAWINQGVSLTALERYEEALACQQRAIGLNPESHQAWTNQGVTLSHLGRQDEALLSHDQAIRLKPDYANAHVNKGQVLAELGQDEAAQACYEHAIALQPGNASARWNLSLLLLKQGRYPAGWEEFEYRWQTPELNFKRISTAKSKWTVGPSAQPLLLWGEQGIGDQILYASILPELASLPQRKLIALDRRLIPLFARSMPGFEFVDLEQVSDALDFAEQLPLGSLPRHFRHSTESFAAARHPFLVADPDRAAALRLKIAQPGRLVCGVSWSSSRKSIGGNKSIRLAQMLPPLAGERLHFVNLQYGNTGAERDALQAQHGVAVQNLDEVDNFHDIDGLAALIMACDIVVTTSNTTAHLAGALGKETLLLLPLGKGKLWYWAEHGGRNPWYPSIKMFSQATPGSWQEPLEQIRQHLENRPWN